MAQSSVLVFNMGVFISTLFLLEFGADKIIDHSAAVASRIGVSEVLVGLLTAGAEWEELAVVIASLAQGRSSIALGNVVGASISNILGAFSLGLLCFNADEVEFERSERLYSLILLILTTLVAPIIYFPAPLTWRACGLILTISFSIYFLVVALDVAKAVIQAQEGADSEDSDPEDDDSVAGSDTELLSGNSSIRRDRERSLGYHATRLIFGFLAISLAGYVLSQATINIIDQLGISDVLFSVVILAIATTLPEKFIASMSGYRGHFGIMVASCAGSNIFLLSICCGIIMIQSNGHLDGGNVTLTELAVLWVSTAAFTTTIWFGVKYVRWIGAAMLVGYIAFIILEFTIIHRIVD
ncbi:hypothetical protein VHEMI05800 [[Torrubiella] hemipterigena]|uniref:Sodium/calcium exchanger membrane region domain-containing protein n=1 Tax=[Torrubiella] hemipterigena TaxID=1531966 RepID=A0A0A1TJL8_9HYPO|nr:hypothetical protein VHEMI05800 [[Torrubiella] hemipterigena]